MVIVHDCLSQDLLRVRCENCGQALDRKRGLKVANILTCLICGYETEVAECLSHVQSFVSLFLFSEYILNQVESVPLEEIRRTSLLAEKFLCDKLDWAKGIEAAQVCQVMIFKCII